MSGERIRLCFDHRDRSQARTVGKADFATGSFKGASLSIYSNKTIQAGINLLLLVTVCMEQATGRTGSFCIADNVGQSVEVSVQVYGRLLLLLLLLCSFKRC